jgi:tetratricopeptide (TPR) repeat protein
MATDTPSPPADPAWSSKVDIHFNTETNRGNQVGYNYGSITNHFHQTPHDYQCEFPSVSRASLETRLYRKIDQARRLCDARQWVEAKHLLSEILFGGEVFPPPSERTLLQYNLAHTHFSLKELPEALHHFQDLVEKHEERNEQPQGAVADCRLWLGQTLFHLGRYEDASMHLQIFVFTYEEPVESPYKGTNVDGKSKQEEMKQAEAIVAGRIWLGNTFEALKLFSHARQQLETSLTAHKEKFGPTDPRTMEALFCLANFCYRRKDFSAAQGHLQELNTIQEQLHGAEDQFALEIRCMLAFSLSKLERYKEAEPHLQRALGRFDSSRPRTIAELCDTGLTNYWIGRILLQKERHRDIPEARHRLQTALACLSEATHFFKTRSVAETLHAAEQAQEEETEQELQAEALDCKRFLAQATLGDGQAAAAETMYRDVIRATSKTKCFVFLISQCGLAHSLVSQRRQPEAKGILNGIIGPALKKRDCSEADAVTLLLEAGKLYGRLDQHEQGRDCFEEAMKLAPLGSKHYSIHAEYLLGASLYYLGQYEPAEQYLQQAHDRQASASNVTCKPVQFELGWALCENGKFDEAEQYIQPVLSIESIEATQERGHRSSQDDFALGSCHYYMGRIMLHRNDHAEAARQLRVSLSMLRKWSGVDHSACFICQYWLAVALFTQAAGESRRLFEQLFKDHESWRATARVLCEGYPRGLVALLAGKGCNFSVNVVRRLWILSKGLE